MIPSSCKKTIVSIRQCMEGDMIALVSKSTRLVDTGYTNIVIPPPKSFYSKNLLLVQTSPSLIINLSASSLSGDRLVKPKHASVPASSLVEKQGLLRGKPVCCWVWDGGWSQCSPRGRYESSFFLFFCVKMLAYLRIKQSSCLAHSC